MVKLVQHLNKQIVDLACLHNSVTVHTLLVVCFFEYHKKIIRSIFSPAKNHYHNYYLFYQHPSTVLAQVSAVSLSRVNRNNGVIVQDLK